MNARSLCLILTLLTSTIPFSTEAQTSKSDTPTKATAPTTKPAPVASAGTLQLRKEVPGEFEYRILTSKGESSAPNALPTPTGTDSLIALPIAAEYKEGTLEISDTTRGDMARFPIKTDSVLALAESSFKFVRVVSIPVTAGGKPATGVLVSLTSKDGVYKVSRTLQPTDAGIARFDNVPLGQPITTTVKFGANPEKSGIQTLTRSHPPEGVKWDAIDLDWKDVKTVAAPTVPVSSGAVPATAGGTIVPPTLPQAAPVTPDAGGGGLGGVLNTLISLGLLVGIAYGLYWAYQNGKIKTLLEKLGINTATLTTPDAGAVAANPFQKNSAPVQPISDGTADPFAGGTVGVTPSAPIGSGLRLVATMGTYAGQIYPLTGGTIEIGRDATNGIPLPNDTNASRRHATIQLNGGQVAVIDNSSSNGTFINGVRIATQTPTPLNPRDELTVGNTRFRFEA